MDKQFPSFIHNFVKQYKPEVFSNIAKCKSLLLDHAKGEYKSEIRLLLRVLNLGFYTTILNSQDLNLTRMTLIKQLQSEYFISEDISGVLIDLLLLELREFQSNNINQTNSKVHKSRIPVTKNNNAIPPEGLVWIQPGTFKMGSPATEAGRFDDEVQHTVKLTKGFYMGKYVVTQELYQTVMGSNPSQLSNNPEEGEVQEKRPVECVSWYDAIVFCNKLSVLEGLTPVYSIGGTTDTARWGEVPTSRNSTWDAAIANWNANGYRLPTEAEWEYACRAGTTTAYNTGNTISNTTGWYNSNGGDKTHEVGKKEPNAWGLYDMHGNVWEWVWNWYGAYGTGSVTEATGPATGSNRVLRGGSWGSDTQTLRSAQRSSYNPENRNGYIGFRVVRLAP
jgi:formylglycine-generating enzyme